MFTWAHRKVREEAIIYALLRLLQRCIATGRWPLAPFTVYTCIQGLKLARENFQPGMAVHTCNLSTFEAEAGGLP